MIDIRLIRETPDAVKAALGRRGLDVAVIDRIRELDVERRGAIASAEELKAKKNTVSKAIGAKKKRGEDAAVETEAMRAIGGEIETTDVRAAAAAGAIEEILLEIPNLPDPSIPDTDNTVVAVHGETVEGGAAAGGQAVSSATGDILSPPRTLAPARPPAPRMAQIGGEPHWEIATRLGLADFERGVRLAQARFYLLTGLGARLERALIEFMLATALEDGRYTEVMPPLLVNTDSMKGTGQYPKFKEEYFSCEKDGLSLIPTAEVPVTNIHRGEILETLPIAYCAWTPCFRREAGSYGKDTRGLIRVHQFNKIELVKFVAPEESAREHEALTADAERVLERLELPYRKIVLAAADLGFAAAKTYDLEVWCPGLGRYVECSSCSNFTDYQARRMMIRFRRAPGAKPELVHTINGSGVAVGRIWAAILENGLQPDGSILMPKALRPFMGGLERITARPGHDQERGINSTQVAPQRAGLDSAVSRSAEKPSDEKNIGADRDTAP